MAVAMLFLACLVLGLIAVQRMPVALFPALEGETLTVVFSRANSSPDVIEREILNKLESRLGSVPDIRETTGQIRGMQGNLQIEFDPDTDIKIREYEIGRIAARLQREQPRNSTYIAVRPANTSSFDRLVMDISVHGGSRDSDVLFDIAADLIAPRFASVHGVAQATTSGGGGRQVIVQVDPTQASLIGVNSSDITSAIERNSGRLEYVGKIEDENGRTPVLLDGRMNDLQTLEQVRIGQQSPAELRHTSEVFFGYAQQDSFYRVNGEQAVGITIYQEENANLVELGKTLRERVEQVKAEVASMGIDLVVLDDSSKEVGDQLERLILLGLTGLGLSMLVLFVILRQWRAVFVVGIAVPVSIVLALALLYVFGFGINLVTLFGIAVSTGLLVDNSVVVYEAILRGVERNVPIEEATARGLRRTVRAISAASLTTAIVFLPILLVDLGNTFMQEFIKLIAVSMLLPIGTSLFVAVGLVPLLAYRLAGPAAVQRVERINKVRDKRGGLAAPDFTRSVLGGYVKSALRYPASWLTGVVFAVLLTIAFAWIPLLSGAGGADQQNADQVEIPLRFDRGARSIESAQNMMARIEAELLSLEGVHAVTTSGNREEAELRVQFVDLDERPKDLTVGAVRSRVFSAAKKQPGLTAMGKNQNNYDGRNREAGGRFSNSPSYRVVLSGPDSSKLLALADNIEERLEGSDYVDNAWLAVRRGEPEVWVTPNRSVLDSLGLQLTDVLSNLNIAGSQGQTMATDYVLPTGREIPIVVERAGVHDDAASLHELRSMRINTTAGAIRMDLLANERRMRPSPVIVHKNGRREMAVNYRLTSSAPKSGTALASVLSQIEDMVHEVPRPPEYVIETPENDENVSAMAKILLPALLFLFLVLAMTFESLTLPVLVLLSLPLTMLGSGWVLFLSGRGVDPGVLVGLLALIGITVNPAILLVDRMQRKTIDAGWSRGAAALNTVHERTRPVLLVTATTIAALAPLAISTGRQNEIWPGFASTVIGGLLTSTLLTLLVIPVGYILLQRLDQIFGRVGPWLMVGWLSATAGIMTWFIWNEWLVSELWQFVVALLVGGCLLAVIVLLFRHSKPPTPHSDGGPPVLEVKHLGKVYGLPGSFRSGLATRREFVQRVIQRGGEMFSRTDSVERAIVLLIVAAGFGGIAYLTLEKPWGLIAALCVALCLALFTYELRRIAGSVDQAGAVVPHALITLFVYTLPWLAVALYVYWVNVLPALRNESPEMPLIWPILIGTILAIFQLMRWSAVRQNRGKLSERAEGFLRHPRSLVRRWSRRIAGLEMPGQEVNALSGVDFVARRGMIGILGPNGAGKTTLLRQLAGILEPTSGLVKIGGVPIKHVRKHLARWIGYLPQDSGLPESSTPKAYLMYYGALYEIPPDIREERVDGLLDEVGLSGKEHDKIGSLSGGMRQRVAVARTLLRLPPIIIVDEPTVGLDPRERIRFRNLLSRLAQDRIVLFSTHVVEDVSVACDRVLVLANNRLQFDGAPSQLSTHANEKVWHLEQNQSERFELPENAILVDETPTGDGRIRRRVLANNPPSPVAEGVSSNLEDGYLWLIGGTT